MYYGFYKEFLEINPPFLDISTLLNPREYAVLWNKSRFLRIIGVRGSGWLNLKVSSMFFR